MMQLVMSMGFVHDLLYKAKKNILLRKEPFIRTEYLSLIESQQKSKFYLSFRLCF